jgi:Lrp/AsnC family transcriptional regulator, leucine-responsive regulatory protein
MSFVRLRSLTFLPYAKGKIIEKSVSDGEITRLGAELCIFSAMNDGLDEFDLKLLDAVQQDCRLTADQLAERISLSPSAVQRRLRRLREHKIIQAEVAIVSPDALGRSLTAIVEVTLDTDQPKVVEEFQRAIQAAPEVMQGYYVTGNADFVLIVTAKSIQDYEKFAQRFFSKRPHIKYFRTSVVMRRVKWGVTVPVRTDHETPSS